MINKELMKSRNKGLFNSLLEEIKKYPFMLKIKTNYNNGLRFKAVVIDKDWKEVYNL